MNIINANGLLKCSTENLTSGDRVYMRVIAVGTAGQGTPSSYVSKIVP